MHVLLSGVLSRCADDVGESCAGVRVSAGYCMGVLVEGCGDSSVIETSRHDDDRHRCLEHLSGHEMAKIVQTKVAKPGGAAMTEEGFRHTIRLPGSDATVVGKYICLPRWWPGERPVMLLENPKRCGIDVDRVGALGLGRSQHRPVGAFDPTTAKRDPASIDVEVAPAQTEQLRAPRSGDSCGEQEHVQERITVSNEVQQ